MHVVGSFSSPLRVGLEPLLALTQNHSSSNLGITRSVHKNAALPNPTNQPRHLSSITDTSFSLLPASLPTPVPVAAHTHTHSRRRRTHCRHVCPGITQQGHTNPLAGSQPNRGVPAQPHRPQIRGVPAPGIRACKGAPAPRQTATLDGAQRPNLPAAGAGAGPDGGLVHRQPYSTTAGSRAVCRRVPHRLAGRLDCQTGVRRPDAATCCLCCGALQLYTQQQQQAGVQELFGLHKHNSQQRTHAECVPHSGLTTTPASHQPTPLTRNSCHMCQPAHTMCSLRSPPPLALSSTQWQTRSWSRPC